MQSTQENTRFIDIFSPFPCIYHMTNIDPMLFVSTGKAQKLLPHVWGKAHLACITGHHVAFEDFLFVQSEAILGSKDENLVVHGLTCQPFTWNTKREISLHRKETTIVTNDNNKSCENTDLIWLYMKFTMLFLNKKRAKFSFWCY